MLSHMIFFNNKKKKNSSIFLTNTSFENEKKIRINLLHSDKLSRGIYAKDDYTISWEYRRNLSVFPNIFKQLATSYLIRSLFWTVYINSIQPVRSKKKNYQEPSCIFFLHIQYFFTLEILVFCIYSLHSFWNEKKLLKMPRSKNRDSIA